MSVLFSHRCKYNGIWCDCHISERFNAITPGKIYHFLHLKMPLTSQEYDSCFPFVWSVLSFDFDIWLGTFCFEFSSEFSIFVTLHFRVNIISACDCELTIFMMFLRLKICPSITYQILLIRFFFHPGFEWNEFKDKVS